MAALLSLPRFLSFAEDKHYAKRGGMRNTTTHKKLCGTWQISWQLALLVHVHKEQLKLMVSITEITVSKEVCFCNIVVGWERRVHSLVLLLVIQIQRTSNISWSSDKNQKTDLVDGKVDPFTNTTNKSYWGVKKAAWSHGHQELVLQPAFAKSDCQFTTFELIFSTPIARDWSGNGHAVVRYTL